MKISLIIVSFQLFVSVAMASENIADISESNKAILEAYPQSRYIGSSMSLLFGALSINRGVDIFNDDKSDSDKVAALGLLALGSARLIDGGIYLFKMEPGESAAYANKIKTIENLREVSEVAYKRRIIRSALMGATSAVYLHLYFTGDDDYDSLVYPGAALAGLTIFQLINHSAEESVFQNYNLRARTSLQFAPLPGGGLAQISRRF